MRALKRDNTDGAAQTELAQRLVPGTLQLGNVELLRGMTMTTMDLFPAAAAAAVDASANREEASQMDAVERFVQHVGRLIEQLHAEHERHRSHVATLRRTATADWSVGRQLVNLVFPVTQIDPPQLVTAVVNFLTEVQGQGRQLLGLHPTCVIDEAALHNRYVLPLFSQRDFHAERARRHAEARTDAAEPLPPLPRVDVRALVQDLQATYGGERGRRLWMRDTVRKMHRAMALQTQRFIATNGRVEMTLYLNWIDCGNVLSRETRIELGEIADALTLMFTEAGKPVPCGLALLRNGFAPTPALSVRHDITPEVSVRLFKKTAVFKVTEGFAHLLREFMQDLGV